MTMEKLQELLFKYNWPTRTEKSQTTIDDVEKLINFKLPADYKTFLQTFSGNDEFIGSEFVSLWDLDEIIESNTESGLLESLPRTIGIGGNGAGELIAIENTLDDNYRLIITPLLFEKEAHINIGFSFTDFLVRLDSGQEWFT